MTYQIGFIIEQALGHISHGQNLQKNVALDGEIKPYWSLPSRTSHPLARRIPVYQNNWTLQVGWQTRRSLAGFRRQTRLDALFFHTQVTAVLAQDWMRRVPSIVSLDATPEQYDSLGETYAHTRGPEWLENRKWRLNRNCYQTASRLVTWSEWARQGLMERYEVPPEKIVVIPPGVNIHEWAQPDTGHSPDRKIVRILFVGGELQRKGGDVLLMAFRSLFQEISNASGGAGASLELHLVTRDALTPEPGVFVYNHLQPNSPELKALYHQSDIFCLPTRGDCLPMVLSEAGAAGLPLVSTQVGAIPEIVRENVTGLLAPAGNVPALAAVLHRLIDDPVLRARLGGEAARLAARNYNAETNAVRLLELLKNIARRPASVE